MIGRPERDPRTGRPGRGVALLMRVTIPTGRTTAGVGTGFADYGMLL
jgi:hypothetical protein